MDVLGIMNMYHTMSSEHYQHSVAIDTNVVSMSTIHYKTVTVITTLQCIIPPLILPRLAVGHLHAT
jgi:hypothetical protein